VIAGTGSIAFGRDPQGRMLSCGGWGSLFDDAGSGYDLGRKAVRCALRHLDGRGEATRLTSSLRRELGLENLTDVVTLPFGPQDVAALFPVLLREAGRGDAVARKLCQQAGGDLADLALTLVKRFRWKRQAVRIFCAGGVFRSSPLVLRGFVRKVRAQAPNAQVSLLSREPVEGALFLARQTALLPSRIPQET
jgi:N-acetylglucosamine kinase-like BadF-type ATPase